MWLVDQLAEARIEQAKRDGELDDLPGAGRRLDLDDDSGVPTELRMAYRILKNSGYLPPEVQLRGELRDAEALLSSLEDEQARRDAVSRINFLSAKIEQARGERPNLLLEQDYFEKLVNRAAETHSDTLVNSYYERRPSLSED